MAFYGRARWGDTERCAAPYWWLPASADAGSATWAARSVVDEAIESIKMIADILDELIVVRSGQARMPSS